MTSPTPAEKLKSDISSLQSSVGLLQGNVRLSSLRDQMEDMEMGVKGLLNRVQALRPRGYVFEKGLETQAGEMQRSWSSLKPQLELRVNQSCAQLEADLRPIETQLSRLIGMSNNTVMAFGMVTPLKTAVSGLETKVSAVQSSIKGMYNTYEGHYNTLKTHLFQVEWSLSQLDAACFSLLATEGLVMAIKAVWYRDDREDKEDPDGVLFLTDQRLIFEQNEEVATKKVLFITTEKKKVQQMLFEVPVSLVAEIKALKKGLFKNEDHLEIHFNSGAPFPMTFLHIFDQDCTTWQALINNVHDGDIQKTRTQPIEQAEIEKVKKAPTICSSCGGTMTQPVLRGQESMNCPYCGAVIRL